MKINLGLEAQDVLLICLWAKTRCLCIQTPDFLNIPVGNKRGSAQNEILHQLSLAMLYWREAAADRVGAKGTSQWQRTLVGGREDMAIPMCSSGHDHALRHGVRGSPVPAEKGCVWGVGTGIMCLGSLGMLCVEKEVEIFFTDVTEHSVFLPDLLT